MAENQITNRRSQSFDVKQLLIAELGQSGETYVIPAYQRPYAWSTIQVSQLVQDFLDFYSLNGAEGQSRYSLGTVVCDMESPGVFSILDGQQRLTTVDLLLAEIDKLLKCSEHRRIIAAYRYLQESTARQTSPLPECTDQRNAISKALNEYIDDHAGLRSDDKKADFLANFKKCIRQCAAIRRVVIPLSDQVDNEAPAMFEIINMRGQKLSALDILKARLLCRFEEKERLDRALFTHLWMSCDERLARPEEAKEGFAASQFKLSSKDSSTFMPLQVNLTIDEIIEGTEFSNADSVPSTKKNLENESQAMTPPIDMMNMLVIANELFKVFRGNEVGTEVKYWPLTTSDFDKRFNDIVRSKEKGAADVWRLMGALSVVLQTVGNWGLYRNTENDESFDCEPDAFNQLVQTFMAANGYRASAQYWLLLLSGLALSDALDDGGRLPTTRESFLAMRKPNFKTLKPKAYRLLLTWAYYVAHSGQENATKAVLSFLENAPTIEEARIIFAATQKETSEQAKSWRYDDGSISQWDLFLTDYVMWVDARRQQRFETLKRLMVCYAQRAESELKTSEEREIAAALRAFEWNVFEAKALTLRIVGRSDIEHWLAQDRADLGLGDEEAKEELSRRQAYGNLALINANDNSTLGKENTKGKAELVLHRMQNPTMKLLWLAVLSKNFETFAGRHVEELSAFWARYIGEFAF